jgi:hypothetical protein
MRVAVKTRVAVGVGVGVGGTVAGTGVSGRNGVAGTKVSSTIGEGCEVGFGAANKGGSAEGEADSVGTISNDDQAKYNSPTNRER